MVGMDMKETLFWLDGLFPEKITLTIRQGWSVVEVDMDQEKVVASADFSRVDTGLSTSAHGYLPKVDGQLDVRCEFFTVANRDIDARNLIPSLCNRFLPVEGELPLHAQPGVMLADVCPEFSAKHVLLVVPQIWADGVPQVVEAPGEVGSDVELYDNNGRITLMLQAIFLTDAEREYALTYGLDALQEQLTRENVDIRDLNRP